MFKSWTKIIFFTLIVLVGLTISLNYALHYMVNNKLQRIINYNSPNSLYNFTFSKVHLDIWAGDLEIHDVTMSPRKKILDSLALIGKNKRMLIEGSLNTIELKNLDVLRLILHQELSIDSFILVRPQINLRLNTTVKSDTSSTFTKDLVSQSLGYGKIGYFSLEHAKIKWLGVNDDSTVYFSCDSISLLVKDLYTDSIILKQTEPLVFSELLFEGKDFNLNTIKDFSLKAKCINYCYSKNQLVLDKILFRNTLDKITFTQKQAYEKEWVSVDVKKITLSTKNTLHWVEGGYLNINKITIDQPSLFMYKDKRLKDPLYSHKPLPSHSIRSIPIPLLIDTIEVHKGHIRYQEIVTTGKTAGEVSFTNFNIKAYHLTNIDSLLVKNEFFTVDASTLFLNEAPLTLHLKFPIRDKSDKFYASGSIKNMEAAKLNKLLTNMAFVEFQDGYVHSLSYMFTANEDSAIGTLDAHYSDLKITILDTTELFNNKTHKSKKGLGFAANTMLRKNNIPGTKHYLQGHIAIERPKNKAVFNYIWTSIKSGLMTTAISPEIYAKMMKVKKKKKEKGKKEKEKKKKKQG